MYDCWLMGDSETNTHFTEAPNAFRKGSEAAGLSPGLGMMLPDPGTAGVWQSRPAWGHPPSDTRCLSLRASSPTTVSHASDPRKAQ